MTFDEVLAAMHEGNWVLMPEGSSLANMLEVTRRWRVVYSDQLAILFEREEGEGSR